MSFAFTPQDYGPAVAALLQDDRLLDLGPGVPNQAANSLLDVLSIEDVADGREIVDRKLAQCCISGLWLWHNFLDPLNTPRYSATHSITETANRKAAPEERWCSKKARIPECFHGLGDY